MPYIKHLCVNQYLILVVIIKISISNSYAYFEQVFSF